MKIKVLNRRLGFWRILILCVIIMAIPAPVLAQEQQPTSGPVYIVQPGDSLWGIAVRFGVSVDELRNANTLIDPNQLAVGDRLVIPGMEGIDGVISTETINFGETLWSLSRRYQVSAEILTRLNNFTSPVELFAGANLIIPEKENQPAPGARVNLANGQSSLELAAIEGANPWSIALANDLQGLATLITTDVVRLPANATATQTASEASTETGGDNGPGALPPAITSLDIDPLGLKQGKIVEIRVGTEAGLDLGGSLLEHDLHFFPLKEQSYTALQGVHAMTDPGLYPMTFNGTLPDGSTFAFSQLVPVLAVDYPYDQPLTVNPATIDPAVTKPEDAEWTALTTPITNERLWQGEFAMPTPLDKTYCLETNDCWSSMFGNRRSYNGSPYSFFHTGLDVVGQTGVEIYAPAAGIVVFAGPLTVRGNATVINHGQGVYSAYMHQSEILVKVGDRVEAGQLIGKIGATGRVQGPHLHWEIWVNGVQVDPLDWLSHTYPGSSAG